MFACYEIVDKNHKCLVTNKIIISITYIFMHFHSFTHVHMITKRFIHTQTKLKTKIRHKSAKILHFTIKQRQTTCKKPVHMLTIQKHDK